MDPIELAYDSLDAVPEAFRGLYTEKEGKAVLTHVNGIKTQKDVLTVQEALRKEREDHGRAKEALKPWSGLGKTADEIQASLDRIAELEAAASGKIDEKKMEELLGTRLASKTAPLERQLRETTTNLETVSKERDTFRDALYRRDMVDEVRTVATEMKVQQTAIADVELFAQMAMERQEDGTYLSKSGIPGITAGLNFKDLLKDLQKTRPHWWPPSAGGGAGGGFGGAGGGDNPWLEANWNLTAQGKFVQEHGLAKAQEAAKAAGTILGGAKPRPKKQ